jgi:zinc protease
MAREGSYRKMKRYVLVAFVITNLFVFSASQAFELDIKNWNTQNGARVLFVESHDLPMIDVRVTFKAGSSRDGKLSGVSRLANALLVDGTGNHSAEDIAETFESTGAQLGHDSLRDMGFVSLRSLSDQAMLDKTIDLFARIIALPSFPKDAIERDRKSMLIGLAERKKDIGSVVEDAFFEHVYQGHPYRQGPMGSEETLRAITQQDLKDFHAQYYVANNATLAIVGDLTLQQAKQLAEKITAYLKPGKVVEEIPPIMPPEHKQIETIKIPFKASQTHIQQGVPILTRKDPDYFALYVGNHILGGSGFSSRLMQEIREDRGLVYSVYSYFMPMESNGPFKMSLQTSTENAEQAARLLNKLLQDFIKNGPDEKELEHAKSNITGSFPLKIDSNKKIVEYLALIGFYDLPLDYLDSFNDRVNAITREMIKDAFQRRVNPDNMTRIIVGEQS